MLLADANVEAAPPGKLLECWHFRDDPSVLLTCIPVRVLAPESDDELLVLQSIEQGLVQAKKKSMKM
jgi:hypothetical protein